MKIGCNLFSKRFLKWPLQVSRTTFSLQKRFSSSSSETSTSKLNCDLLVIGGGSGGLACSQEAAALGKKVILVDYVKPSPQGTSWGLGGTCVNVGCIPKKLMHHSALIRQSIEDSPSFGWKNVSTPQLDWKILISNIQNHIKSLNWGYRLALVSKSVNFINGFGVFLDPHTVECTKKDNIKVRISADKFVIATGTRPKYPDIPGAKEYAISSDDLFSLKDPPGKTLIIGASYVALECAGFLRNFGFETHVMARSIFLRGFDQQMAEMVVNYMTTLGTKFIRESVPTKIEKLSNGKLKVYWKQGSIENSEIFETVLMAIGRQATTNQFGIDKIGVKTDNDGKIFTMNEQTNLPHIYALGDILKGKPELTPVAIQAGRLLARHLYNNSSIQMAYDLIPTTIFTPLEYASCGLSEEAAIQKYGKENIEVYHAHYQPLEWTLPERDPSVCYSKLICNKLDQERVVGAHILSPNAGEIMQAVAVAMKCKATKADFDLTVGIHPTVAEEITLLNITKSSGVSPIKTNC